MAFAFLACALSGCSGGPLAELAGANPWIRHGWAEDEQYAATYHQRAAQFNKLRRGAARMNADEQHNLSAQLARQLADEKEAVLRIEIVAVLAELPTQGAEQALRASMEDTDTDVRVAGCRAWGRRGGGASLQELAKALGADTDSEVRLAAAAELGRFDDLVARNALGAALHDADPAVQHRVVQSLAKTTNRDYGSDFNAWREYLAGGNPPPPETPSLAERVRTIF